MILKRLKELYNTDFNKFELFCLMDTGLRAGFIAVKDKKSLNAVFTPAIFGRGLGAKLFSFAINELKADKIDVNEKHKSFEALSKIWL
ncbi:hypothetical protein [Campylobacter geochelonis]|uniref:hypothetical protein n=1 Tax=Campylobacter geochelonis TaxID=1780362 RepID=UPI00094C4AFD|nr:hypothetical protein [Campylobacter geochelonis]